MALRLFDSFTRQKVEFVPVVPGKVGMYVCGPTPYAAAHIGHAYSAICFDLIRRSLTWLGFEVTYVRNITDVDDKIIKRANEEKQNPMELAARYADEYNRDMSAFGVLTPTVEPKVSTHIVEIVDFTKRLIEAGKAYESGGDVYYRVDAFAPYGKLSGQSLDDLRAGARVDVNEQKESPADFALWKTAKPGEPSWPSPWGNGRPGWHIECSAMSHKHLGVTFDIHGGGKDLVFPHHENEIAQSQGALGEGTFAHYWVHNGFLNFDGEKMSKSLGNVFSCGELANSVGTEAVRFYFLSHHYRSPIEFEVAVEEANGIATARFPGVEAADRRLAYFYNTLARLDAFLAQGGDGGEGDAVPEAGALVAAVRIALEDDFNAPVVIAALGEAAKVANRLVEDGKGIDKGVRRRSIAAFAKNMRSVGTAIGVLASEPVAFLRSRRDRVATRLKLDVAAVEKLVADRYAARAAKDYAAADVIRGQLTAMNIEVLDTQTGSDWRIVEGE
ncbi:MAG: cysteine--tRNA ligase [Myxococcales bacterium]|nr:cysteine--tRNA ligase [Myxococcales bacterium]